MHEINKIYKNVVGFQWKVTIRQKKFASHTTNIHERMARDERNGQSDCSSHTSIINTKFGVKKR